MARGRREKASFEWVHFSLVSLIRVPPLAAYQRAAFHATRHFLPVTAGEFSTASRAYSS
jgi:hypothetical protein